MDNDIIKNSCPAVFKIFKRNSVLSNEMGRIDTECKHTCWTKRCSFCRYIMESDRITNTKGGTKIRVLYTDFDSLVTNNRLSIKLQKLGATQDTKFYWVVNDETKVLSLRSKTNTMARGYSICSAYTSSEMVKLLHRTNRIKLTSSVYRQIGEIAHEPNKLAKLYITLLKDAKR